MEYVNQRFQYIIIYNSIIKAKYMPDDNEEVYKMESQNFLDPVLAKP